jgi:hypothetical protein
MSVDHLCHSGEVDRRIFPDCGVGAPTGLNPNDTILWQNLHAHQRFSIFLRVNVIGNDPNGMCVPQGFAQSGSQGRFASANRATNADTERAIHLGHVRKILEYWVSCFIAAMSVKKLELAKSSNVALAAVSASVQQIGMKAWISF